MSKPSKKSELSIEKSHYEFFGPPGVFVISFGLPIVCYLTTFICNDISGCPAPVTLHLKSLTLEKLKAETGWPGLAGLFDSEVFFWVLAYYFLSLVLQATLPAEEVEGVELRSGGRLKYRFNTFTSALVTLGAAVIGTIFQGPEFVLWTFIWDKYPQILTANLTISYVLATYLYVRSFSVVKGNKEKREIAAGGHTGNILYDWFIGRELNPRITIPLCGEIDIKVFMELRPGMLGWILLNLASVAHQYKVHGFISDSIVLITFFQALYVLDALYFESSILSTIDVIADGFGFMLVFGDLVWLPFTYSWQTRYLAVYPVQLGLLGTTGVIAIVVLGYSIFRGSNNEKARFRSNPQDPRISHLKYIETAAGSKLLISGWWGTARHINYLGDWLMSWGYCLPTAFAGYVVQKAGSSALKSTTDQAFNGSKFGTEVVQGEARGSGIVFTYFYMLYFAILLIHRDLRDDEKCSKKYGKDWEEYKRQVRYKIIPYVY